MIGNTRQLTSTVGVGVVSSEEIGGVSRRSQSGNSKSNKRFHFCKVVKYFLQSGKEISRREYKTCLV